MAIFELTKKDISIIALAINCGMPFVNKNIDGELEFIGTQKQWQKFEELKNNLLIYEK